MCDPGAMGRRADKAKDSAEEITESAVAGVRRGAHAAVDTAEDFYGKSKRKTKKARRKVDDHLDKAEKKLGRLTRKAERKTDKVRRKTERRVDKVTGKLPDA